MRSYEDLYPGATKIFFKQFQKQTDHRIDLESFAVRSKERRANVGQWLAFTLLALVIVGGFAMTLAGYEITGLIAALSGMGSVLALFFGRRKVTDTELARKD
jgi:hypothetical protein